MIVVNIHKAKTINYRYQANEVRININADFGPDVSSTEIHELCKTDAKNIFDAMYANMPNATLSHLKTLFNEAL